MYERHFGITAPPFQLSPNPFFYFDSEQHHAALVALRQAFALERPFIVLSGEIGAGKTTLLRAWLAEAEDSGIVATLVTSTQLDADELLRAVATGFGIPGSGADPATLEQGLRGFFGGLRERAALLVVDEAQHLDRDALRRLVGLADMAVEEGAVLRVCLAGQPPLRARVADPSLPELAARLQCACHLGPLPAPQTRQYVEHRLRKVGWSGVPSFDAAAFDEIHRFTGGVPRRINVLGNRLMLSQFLGRTVRIDAAAVAATAHALHAEIGDGAVVAEAPLPAPTLPVAEGALLVVANGRSDHIKAGPLLKALAARDDLPPAMLVSAEGDTQGDLDASFRGLLQRRRPAAVIVFDGDSASLRCARIAHALDVPLVHVGADRQSLDEALDGDSPRGAIAHLADLRFDCQPASAREVLSRPGDALPVGSLLVDALQSTLQSSAQPDRDDASQAIATQHADGHRGYGVVVLKAPAADAPAVWRQDLIALLRDVSRDLPLVWPMRHAMLLAGRESGLARTIAAERIACIEALDHAAFIRLLCDATCVLTDCADVLEEAAALGVPCLSLGLRHAAHIDAGGWLPGIDVGASVTRAARAVWQVMFNGVEPLPRPPLWDGQAAARIAAHLAQWFAHSRDTRAACDAVAARPPG